MSKKPTPGRITKLKLTEVSMVDEGDNPGAMVEILKRREPSTEGLAKALSECMEAAGELSELAAGEGGMEGVEKAARILGDMDMDIDQLNERLGQIETSLETITKERDDLSAKVTELTGQLETVTKERDDAVAKGGDDKGDDEDILKGLPEPIRKRLEDAEKAAKEASEAVEKARDENDLKEQVAKVRELGVKDADGMGAVLHRIAKGKSKPEDAAKVVELITIAKNVGEKSDQLFEAIGKAGGKPGEGAGADAATATLNERIEGILKAKPGTSREAAYAEVIDADPKLYEELAKIKPTVGAE
jgi:predicted transcriptional regulator